MSQCLDRLWKQYEKAHAQYSDLRSEYWVCLAESRYADATRAREQMEIYQEQMEHLIREIDRLEAGLQTT